MATVTVLCPVYRDVALPLVYTMWYVVQRKYCTCVHGTISYSRKMSMHSWNIIIQASLEMHV